MLFFLTGDVQIGKTRWLSKRVDELRARGVECWGVIAPGTWVERDGGLEKTGIDNVLLPDGTRIPFARRRDLALAAGAFDSGSQAAKAQLGWAIDDQAIQDVNDHFRKISGITTGAARMLVIDELGRLELERGAGLVEAVALLDRGATTSFQHAIVIVREQLLHTAQTRFAQAAWHGTARIAPDDESASLLLDTASPR